MLNLDCMKSIALRMEQIAKVRNACAMDKEVTASRPAFHRQARVISMHVRRS
jgi:hypothetical protein